MLKVFKKNNKILDFGCGVSQLLEVLLANKAENPRYVGLDIHENKINKSKNHFKNSRHFSNFEFIVNDLILNTQNIDYTKFQADIVCSFEVAEHVGKQNLDIFLKHFSLCGKDDGSTTYYLSTPAYSERQGAAEEHTYDSGDGRGRVGQEHTYVEMKNGLEKYFDIVEQYGTFASQVDYVPHLNDWQRKMYEHLKKYYDNVLLSNIIAPFVPQYSRNILWVLKRKHNINNLFCEEIKQKALNE